MTTTADKGELLPCPFCGGNDQFVERANYSACFVQCDCNARGPIGVQESDAEEMPGRDDAIAAWNRRAANEGQDGLTEDEIWKIAEQTLNSRTIKASSGYDIHFFARAIARHLSIKQATIPGNATMYDPGDVAFPKGFMPVDAQADHSEQHLKMVKADAVKMPEPVGQDEIVRMAALVMAAFAFPGRPGGHSMDQAMGALEAIEFRNRLQAYATAHTAEAVRELVDGLRHAADWINSEPHGDNCFLGDELSGDRCWCGKDSFVEATDALLAKYAPSQEGGRAA